MASLGLSGSERALIDSLVEHYISDQDRYQAFLNGLQLLPQFPPLSTYVHSTKARLKDPTHLREKLERKMAISKKEGVDFSITTTNLFQKINDLAGLRILHLNTRQFPHIHRALLDALAESQIPLVDKFARTWDIEADAFFNGMGIRTETSETLYTSVHYIVEANMRTKRTGEIQVRTLAEEIWGEVDHSINYPHPSEVLACKEQIRVLARVISSCTRLVDSIIATNDDAIRTKAKQGKMLL